MKRTNVKITEQFLRDRPNVIFVFGDNYIRKGKAGAAKLRDEPNTYGFITKKYPNNKADSFFTKDEYKYVFEQEIEKLKKHIENNPDKIFLITKLGSNLANKYKIFEYVIAPRIFTELAEYDNIIFLW